MKRPALVYSVEILLFLLLLGGVFLLAGPVSSRIDTVLGNIRDNVFSDLEERTGLQFSYEAMSPSIFNSLRVRNLSIIDSTNAMVLADIAEADVVYSFFDLITGNPAGAIRKISIKNASVSVDLDRNRSIIERLSASGTGTSDGSVLSDIIESGDIVVTIRNLSLTLKDERQRLDVLVSNGSATVGTGGIGFDVSSRMAYTRDSITEYGPITASFSANGTIDSELENGSATFSMDSLSGSKFSLSRFALVTSYRQGFLQVNSVQDLQPVQIALNWDIPSDDLSVLLECDQLFPLRWVTLDESLGIPESLANMTVTGTAGLSRKNGDPLSYTVDLQADIPDSFRGGGTAIVRIDGDDTTIYSHTVGFNGPRYNAVFTGLYNFREQIPEGLLSVKHFHLPGGEGIRGDLYVRRNGNGFEGVIPELRVHDARYSNVTMVINPRDDLVMEFSLEARDPTGRISARGSYSTGEMPFFEGYLAFDSVSVGNTGMLVHRLMYPEQESSREKLQETLDPFGLTTEIFFSTDFTRFAFNCTRLVVASKEKDGLYVLLSAKGNESSVDITNITVSPDRYSVNGNIHAEYDLSGDIVFDTGFTINSIPYYFSGMYSDRILSLYGDYSMAVSMVFNPGGGMSGVMQTSGFPIPLKSYLFSLSLDTEFTYNPPEGFRMNIQEGAVEEIQGNLPLDTRLRFAGTVENTGVFLHELALYDRYSTVTGMLRLTAFQQSDGTRQFEVMLDMMSQPTDELYRITGTLVNSSELFFEGNARIDNLPFMRFAKNQTRENRVSLNASISGTPETVFGAVEIPSMSIHAGDFNILSHASVLVEDGLVTLYDTELSWKEQHITDISASLALDSLEADFSASFSGILDDEPITTSLGASFLPVINEQTGTGFGGLKNLESFTITAFADSLKWTNITPQDSFPVTIIREPGITAIYAGNNDIISGFLLDDGTVSLQASGNSPVTFTADGMISESEISVSVRDVSGYMEKVWPFTNIPQARFDSGHVTGFFDITGLLRDPEFYGSFQAQDVVVYSPDHLVEKFIPEPFTIVAEGKTLTLEPTVIRSDKSEFVGDALVLFDRWKPKSAELHVQTMPGKPILVDTANPYFVVEGRATCNLYLYFSREAYIVRGPIGFDRGSFAIMFSGFMGKDSDRTSKKRDIFVDLDLDVGKKVEFRWPSNDFPILRGLIQADEPVIISMDTSRDSFSLKGSANLKGGEIFYIKRSFYLRQGSILFNENQDIFDPMISLRAEIRERDEKGEPVRIILYVENQPLSSFTPVLYSEPPKSTIELMALLGQAASADSTQDTLLRDTIVTASDIFAQMGLFRTVENSIRDVLHLDIFSIRTLLIQNAIFRQSMQPSALNKDMTIGNYFDNTTVYMGKYFGSAVYADALLHFSYYDPKSVDSVENPIGVYENLLFQPELGLEISSPFFTVRWSILPDSPDTFFIADTSVTLSWKFSY